MSVEAKLYHIPYFVSSVTALCVYELGIEDKVEVVIVGPQEMKDDYHFMKHPQGKIPFYTEGDDFTLIESSAIMLYLLEKYDAVDKRLTNFADLHQRGKFYQFLLNCPSQIYPNFVQLYSYRVLFPEGHPARNDKMIATSLDVWHLEIAPFLVAELGSKQYIVGDQFTAADCLVGYNIVLAEMLGELSEYPTLVAYLERIKSRPSFTRIFSEENKQYLFTLERYGDSLERKNKHIQEMRAARTQRLSEASSK
ncbi:hypothetical protein SAMD00019534_123980 [Acytostelium subglobosum LB1]|uniref:hypothetical protein n=1 Tax=Acytostelium subglobosum LB1 TaxID=1410327 RepID=UPI000644D31C|nr:hypothetical protein SAMD00019534_123980 [Acytostelium subglobosum LB1]GAM29222.1 hypothetical protein SAMD00019534_123980 [Acytostelium subglobosum LB1]|eukprot:XP_012747796.1 hypothetical protein SAMD00019534_123980 [Acytostelium subglobosum LB1]